MGRRNSWTHTSGSTTLFSSKEDYLRDKEYELSQFAAQDVFSLACTFLYIYFSASVDNRNEIGQIQLEPQDRLEEGDRRHKQPLVFDFLVRMAHYQPSERPTAAEALKELNSILEGLFF